MDALSFERPTGQVETIVIRRPGKQAYQQNPPAAENEYRVLRLARSLGLATPRPLYLDTSGTIFPAPYLVIEYIPGKPEFSPGSIAGFARQMAAHLSGIHSAPCPAPDCPFLPRMPANFTAAFGGWPLNGDPFFEEQRIRGALQNASPFPPAHAPALLHGDYWPGNILWRDGRLVAVIDWEDAQIGDPLLDFAISRLDILWIFGQDAFEAFTHHYLSSIAIDTTALPYWDLFAALRLVRLAGGNMVDWAAFFQPYGRADITGQSIRGYYQYFITQAFEKLEQKRPAR